MPNFQNKRKIKLVHQLPVMGILLFILIVFAVGVIGFAKKAQEAYENRKVAENKISELRARKNALNKDIDEINTDFGKEKIFRENYGLGRPGEEVVIIVDDKNVSKESTEKESFWGFLKNLFGL